MANRLRDLGDLLKDIRIGVRLLDGFGVRFIGCRHELLAGGRALKTKETNIKTTLAPSLRGESVGRVVDEQKSMREQPVRLDAQPPPSDTSNRVNQQRHFFGASETKTTRSETTAEIWQPNPLSRQQIQDELDRLRDEIGVCTRCPLHAERNNIVFGEGNPKALIVLVGEGPGREEDRTGRPFVGRAGQLLDRILAAMGYQREDVYICNVVKCRPPSNRTPQDEEMRTCGMFLVRQLEVIRPRYILALGATAVKYLLCTNQPMSKLRGRLVTHASGAKVLPTYHPAYLLRNPAAKKLVWEDVQKIMNDTDRSMERREP